MISQNPVTLQAVAKAYTEVATVERIREQHEKADAVLRKAIAIAERANPNILAALHLEDASDYNIEAVNNLAKRIKRVAFFVIVAIDATQRWTQIRQHVERLGLRDIAGVDYVIDARIVE